MAKIYPNADTVFVNNFVTFFTDLQELYYSYVDIELKLNKYYEKSYACKKIYKICTKKRNKAMYIIGKKYKFLNFGQKLISKNKLLNITGKKY